MADLISFPFRLTPGGVVASHDETSDEYLGEELAQLVQTQPGERELVPTYGINDAAYAGFDATMLAAQVQVFGPPVIIQAVEVRYLTDAEQDVVVRFSSAVDVTGGESPGPVFDPTFTDDEEFSGALS